MPATTLAHPAANQNSNKAPTTALVPFTRSAREHTEVFMDVSQALGATSVQLPQADVAAYGFMRGIFLIVEAASGTGTATVTKAEDAPWSSIAEVVLKDVNGAPLVGPFTGYDLYLLNKWGGYFPDQPDPKQRQSFSDVATGANGTGNFSFGLYIPVEVGSRDALAALANQNAASTYKLAITLADKATVYGATSPTTPPTVRVRAALAAWTQPTQADLRGNAQATTPPANGTTSYWSKTTFNVAAGSNLLRLPRVGNYLRELIFVFRATSDGTRATGDGQLPDPFSLYWDTRLLHQYPITLLRDQMIRRTALTATADTAGGRDKGVLVQDFAHDFDGLIGYELRDGWIPTTQSTRLEVQGNFGAAGVLTVLTNDVAPAGEIFV